MCLQCAIWLCTPESTETQTQKKHTQIYIIHVCRRAEKHTQIYYTWIRKIRKTHKFWQSRLARRAVNCCHDGPGHGWCRYSPQRLRIGSWPLTSTLQHQNNSLWTDTATSKQWHQDLSLHIPPCHLKSWLVILMRPGIFHTFYYPRGGQGGKLPKAFCSFAHLLGQEHAWFGHKKVVHKYATYTNLQK